MLIFFFTTFLLSLFVYSMMLKHLHYYFQRHQQKQIQKITDIQLPTSTRLMDLVSIKFIELSARSKIIVLTSSGSLSVLQLLQQFCQLPYARRKLVLLDCLRDIQFVYIFGLLVLLGNVNPWLILSISLFSYFILRNDHLKHLAKAFIFSGMFLLITYEYGLKFFQSIQMFFVENPSWMFISGNGIEAMLFCLVSAFILGLFIQIDYWSLILGYLLILTGIISISSALAILAGELFARIIRHQLIRNTFKINYYLSSKPRNGIIKLLNYPSLVQILAGFIALAVATDFSAINPFHFELTAMSQVKAVFYLISSLVFMMCYWIITMFYGHFAASDE